MDYRRLHPRHSSIVLLFAVAFARAGTSPPPHVHDFGQVNAHLFRGAEPSRPGLRELELRGVKLVIDLRESGEATVREREEATSLGMQYVNVPMPAWAAPTRDQVQNVLSLLIQHPREDIFVHCRRGKDRTGTVIACYRIQHDGWTNSRALEEANGYGMSRLQRAMRSFVRHFSPLSAPALPPVAADRSPGLPTQP